MIKKKCGNPDWKSSNYYVNLYDDIEKQLVKCYKDRNNVSVVYLLSTVPMFNVGTYQVHNIMLNMINIHENIRIFFSYKLQGCLIPRFTSLYIILCIIHQLNTTYRIIRIVLIYSAVVYNIIISLIICTSSGATRWRGFGAKTSPPQKKK